MTSLKIYKIIKTKKGFAMLFAVLLSSFLITLGISIFNLSLKEIQITTSVRDSQIAYYAADSARECAVYWDVKRGAFRTYIDVNTLTDASAVPIVCNGRTVTDMISQLVYPATQYSTTTFFMASSTDFIQPDSSILITKTFDPSNGSIETVIQAQGHNTGVIGRRVERGISQTY